MKKIPGFEEVSENSKKIAKILKAKVGEIILS